MSNLYATAAMAAGYARWRPAVHPLVIEKVAPMLEFDDGRRAGTALDIGCGSGLSTAALERVATCCVGIEPTESMLRWAHLAAPSAHVATARAEQLPIASGAVDLITAAGSLNYVDLAAFFPEARRVLVRGGRMAVYDFGPGRSFRDSDALDRWYDEFERLYPFPPCRDLTPASLATAAEPWFESAGNEQFEVSLQLSEEFYVEYAMTETSVSAAAAGGVSAQAIRDWCASTLAPVFDGRPRDVLFRGYICCLR